MNVLLPNAIKEFTPQQEYQIHVFYADSLFQNQRYSQAENIYKKALDLRKAISRNKKKTQSLTSTECGTETDLKYQLYLCAKKRQDYRNALHILESIPQRQRSAKINLALGEMYHREKSDSNATACYKEVLKENPLAFQVIIILIKLNVKAKEIINIVMNVPNAPKIDWLPTWITAKSMLYSPDTSQAVNLFKQLLSKPCFSESPEIMSSLGQALYYNGDYKKALPVFKKAFSANNNMTYSGMDVYAACLAKENQVKELEKWANKLLPICEAGELSPEPWIILGYYCFQTNKKEAKAIYFAQKACFLSENSTEALLLKGMIRMEARNHIEAIGIFTEASQSAPYRFEAIKSLAEAHMTDNRKAQAIATANSAFRIFGPTPRTLTLFSSVLLAEPEKPSNKKNAKTSLEKAVRLDSGHLPAVYLLANLYIEEKNIDKAIEVLTKALESESNNKLHRMLGDCYTEKNDHDKALHHHNIAQKLDVNYRSSSEASQRLEQQSSRTGNIESSLELDEEPQETDNEVDEDETDNNIWSDTES
ncbi:Anaphase-promoting complex subunit 7-like protein [Dinothrombium tinctorium]|uniref:Anaphase-promoting complex subunit 7-like protein n=1 Tax=Dinothrombium tinctorium TaxID=1965070 RepID=A0A3S3P037_9ACAR|nr:Anaphase-promoting complex subunit 7-like protein [Dinothrombium tinctorium]